MGKEILQLIVKVQLLLEVSLLEQHVVQVHEQPRLGERLPQPHAQGVGDLKSLHETNAAQERRVLPQAVGVGGGEEGTGWGIWILKMLGHSEAVVQVPLELSQDTKDGLASLIVAPKAGVSIDPVLEDTHGVENAWPVDPLSFVAQEHVDVPSGTVAPGDLHQD
jgi:hypothetical protein